MFFGAIFFGFISDKIGRKKRLALTLMIYSTFTALCGLASNFTTLLVIRIISGFGLGGALPVRSLRIGVSTSKIEDV